MKKGFLLFAAGFALSLCVAAGITQTIKSSAADVNQYQGVYIFTDCKPAREYKYLGSVKPKGRGWDLLDANSNQYTELRDRLIKAAKKQYPDCDGLILDLKDKAENVADAVQFK
ncbi:MAG: hypothetical protein ABIQ88_02335 [Chitinophagaceae bacterium]